MTGDDEDDEEEPKEYPGFYPLVQAHYLKPQYRYRDDRPREGSTYLENFVDEVVRSADYETGELERMRSKIEKLANLVGRLLVVLHVRHGMTEEELKHVLDPDGHENVTRFTIDN